MAEAMASSNRSKPYDVVIYGASGFTGKYVVREALKFLNTRNSPLKSLALAGRSPTKLAEALKWASFPNSPPEIPLLAADSSDHASLARLAAQSKIILSCIGPFRLYGEPVISACVESGCDYLDICGEAEFIEMVEGVYHDKAVSKGSLVVSGCGFDSVLAEIGLLLHSKQWSGSSVPNRVDAYLNVESEKRLVWNFTTYESLLLRLANPPHNLEEFRTRAQPVIPGPSETSNMEHQKELNLWALKLPSPDSIAVQRTFSKLVENPRGLPGVNEDIEYAKKREAFWSSTKPAHFDVKLCSKSLLGLFPSIILGIFMALLCKIELGRWLLLKYPSFFSLGSFRKGGPTEEEVTSATFKMWFVGRGYSDGSIASEGKKKKKKMDTEVITRITGPEVGYLTTPIVMIQCALILLNDRHNLPGGGVYTPGIVFGPTDIQQRLQENGISFDFISKKALSS